MPNQTRHWCFTLNNWTVEEDEHLRSLSNVVDYLILGYEVGVNGTNHIQGYVISKRRKRLSEIKNLLGQRIHAEPKRGTVEEASAYCKKDGVFFELGVLPVGTRNGGILGEFKEWAMRFADTNGRSPTDREIALSDYGHLWLQYGSRMQAFVSLVNPQPKLIAADADLREWQANLKECLLAPPPDDRSILFFVDDEGGKGKSWFQRYMISNYGDSVQILSVAKRDDIAHAIDPSKSIFMFNVPRGGMEFFNYHIIEQLKDRLVFSPKYNSAMKMLNCNPHIVVFCNESPDETKMTPDRYIIETM